MVGHYSRDKTTKVNMNIVQYYWVKWWAVKLGSWQEKIKELTFMVVANYLHWQKATLTFFHFSSKWDAVIGLEKVLYKWSDQTYHEHYSVKCVGSQ